MSFWHNMLANIVSKTGYTMPVNNALKTDGKKGSGFSRIITGLQQNRASLQQLTPPVPPSPPVNLQDVEAQKKYNQELLTYNQKFQTYHMQMMQLFSQRFWALQQTFTQNRQSQRTMSLDKNLSLSPLNNSGVGGILEGDSDI